MSNKQRHKSVIHGVLKPYCFLGKVQSKVLNQQNFHNFSKPRVWKCQVFPFPIFCFCFTNFPERFAFSCMFCLTVVVSYVFFQHFRGKLTRGCAKLNHLRMLYVWPLSCHMQWSRKIKTIPDSHIILNAQSGLKYRTVVVVSVVTFFFLFRFSQ